MTTSTKSAARPWYREPWPWLLIAGPAIVIAASLTTAWLAIKSNDGLVSGDYYKEGLAAGETLARSRRAEELGIVAGLRLQADLVRVRLASRTGKPPAALILTLSHPTRAGIDQTARLTLTEDGYAGKLNLPTAGHWLVQIEDAEKTWRLMGSVVLPAAGEVAIGSAGDGAKE